MINQLHKLAEEFEKLTKEEQILDNEQEALFEKLYNTNTQFKMDFDAASNTNNPMVLSELATSKHSKVREAVAANKQTPKEILQYLLSDNDAWVRNMAKMNLR